MNQRRIYMSLALWSEKRRASAEAVATIRESFRPVVRRSPAQPKPPRLTRDSSIHG
jgi:hypothetical protein